MSRTVLEVNHLTKQYGKNKVIDGVALFAIADNEEAE